MKKTGIFIIIVGLVLTFFTSFTAYPKSKTLILPQVESVKVKPQNLNWYPLFSISIFVIGAVIIGRTSNI